VAPLYLRGRNFRWEAGPSAGNPGEEIEITGKWGSQAANPEKDANSEMRAHGAKQAPAQAPGRFFHVIKHLFFVTITGKKTAFDYVDRNLPLSLFYSLTITIRQRVALCSVKTDPSFGYEGKTGRA